MIEKFYEEELRYLYESGREFARAHPDRAQFLNIEAVGDRDPYVERLFEGFAFLAARIREKLDDSLPELTEGIVNLMWPHFQQTIPSIAMIEFRPRKGFLQETKVLGKGAELLTNPLGSESVIGKFTTTNDVPLHPVTLDTLEKKTDTKGKGSLAFSFLIDPGVKWQALNLSPLRMYIHAELPTALAVHELMTQHCVKAEVIFDDGRASFQIDPGTAVATGGLSPSESLLPADSRSFWGYMLLLEYFVYPEKFLFVDLSGFDVQQIDFAPEKFTIKLTFDKELPAEKPFGMENFRLFCSPAVNLFRQDTEPVRNTGKETEYRVIGDAQYRESVEPHSIIAVTGIDRGTGEKFPYEPFHSFKALGKKNTRTYTTHYRMGFSGKRELYITIGSGQATGGELHEENLSIEAWCTNGVLAREEIREGGINKPGASFPDYVMFSNITRPALPCLPPANEDYLWVFLSHLGATYSSFASADSLKTFLSLYEWSRSEGRKRRIEAISDVSVKPAESVIGGTAVRGVQFTVTLQESEFQDSGDMHLFGEVLKEFLANYISINSFLDLVIISRPSGRQARWSSLRGKKCPI